jgi:hypothetical protein
MKMKIIANVKVGKAQVKTTAPSHIAGTRQGNKLHSLSRTRGLHKRKGGKMVKATASRSTGVNALFRNSIVPGAPRLTPM